MGELLVTIPQERLKALEVEILGVSSKCLEFIEENRILRQRVRELEGFLEKSVVNLNAADALFTACDGYADTPDHIQDAADTYKEICDGSS